MGGGPADGEAPEVWAEAWLRRHRLEPSPERMRVLLVMLSRMPWGSWQARACRHLVKQGRVPSGDDIMALVERWRACLAAFPGVAGADGVGQLAPEAIALIRLEEARRPVTPEAIAELVPYVPADGRTPGPWMALVSRGLLPTPEAVQEEQARMRERRKARRVGNARARLVGREAEIVEWVAAYRARHAQGPLWREVWDAFEMSRQAGGPILHRLCREGWLHSTRRVRSLRPGARWAGPAPAEEASGERLVAS
jgi:hypothetical protein